MHRYGFLKHRNDQVVVTAEDEKRAVDCVLKAGEISLHSGVVIHGSEPNRPTPRRCGLAISDIPTSVKPRTPKEVYEGDPSKYAWENRPILVRGEDQEKNFGERAKPFTMKSRL